MSNGGHIVGCPYMAKIVTTKTVKAVTPQDEPLRYALALVEKWSQVMGERWRELREDMNSAGLPQPRNILIGDKENLLCTLDSEYLYVLASGNQGLATVLRNLDQHPTFDVSTLPEIQRLVSDALKEKGDLLRNTLENRERLRLENQKKLKKALGAVVDELGADIMQYGPAPSDKTKGK